MAFPWILAGALAGPLLGLIFGWSIKVWSKLDDHEKKLVIDAVVSFFEVTFRAYYKWWRNQGG